MQALEYEYPHNIRSWLAARLKWESYLWAFATLATSIGSYASATLSRGTWNANKQHFRLFLSLQLSSRASRERRQMDIFARSDWNLSSKSHPYVNFHSLCLLRHPSPEVMDFIYVCFSFRRALFSHCATSPLTKWDIIYISSSNAQCSMPLHDDDNIIQYFYHIYFCECFVRYARCAACIVGVFCCCSCHLKAMTAVTTTLCVWIHCVS